MTVDGIQSRSMQVGGLAMHWGGVTPRFSPEDFRVKSLYGVGTTGRSRYDDLDPFYQEAEERIGVAGEQGPAELDPRAQAVPDAGAAADVQPRAAQAVDATRPASRCGVSRRRRTPWPTAGARSCCRNDTCCAGVSGRREVFAGLHVERAARVEASRARAAHARQAARASSTGRTGSRERTPCAVDRGGASGRRCEFRAKTFVVAAGYAWSPHLLLLSRSERFPNGSRIGPGLVGKYMTGHRNVSAFVKLPLRLYPGMNEQHSLVTKQFMRHGEARSVRAPRSARVGIDVGRRPRLEDDDGALLLGDDVLADWRRAHAQTGTARVRAYYDVIPDRESELTLDESRDERSTAIRCRS